MRFVVFGLLAIFFSAAPSAAVDFLGVELCEGSVDTAVVLPVGSPLTLESSEIGRHGGLLLLFTTENGDIMDHIDNLMAAFTDTRGTGDAKKLQWTGNQITAYAQLIKKGYAALAVSTTDPCRPVEPAPVAETTDTMTSPETAAETDVEETQKGAAESAAIAAAAVAPDDDEQTPSADEATEMAVAATVGDGDEATTPAPEPESTAQFSLKGKLKHTAAEDGWVDVMGVVVNTSGDTYAVASFDLSLYDGSGDLICVDTISVNQLRDKQERAFRASIRCADYDAAAVASWKLQFAGAH